MPVVADGGMRRGGELAKAIAAGADALMLGLAARARRRGTRTRHELGHGRAVADAAARHAHPGRHVGPLERILIGPSHVTDGTENLVGALRQSMAALGAPDDPRAMQEVEIVYAPAIGAEGKSWQRGR